MSKRAYPSNPSVPTHGQLPPSNYPRQTSQFGTAYPQHNVQGFTPQPVQNLAGQPMQNYYGHPVISQSQAAAGSSAYANFHGQQYFPGQPGRNIATPPGSNIPHLTAGVQRMNVGPPSKLLCGREVSWEIERRGVTTCNHRD